MVEFLEPNVVVKRPQAFLQTGDIRPVGSQWCGVVLRRPPPSTPQFDGTVIPAGVRTVYLRKLGDAHYLEKTVSDGSGYFQFQGIYDEREQYEFVVIDNDGTVSQVFHVDNPVYLRSFGNPAVDSTGYTRA